MMTLIAESTDRIQSKFWQPLCVLHWVIILRPRAFSDIAIFVSQAFVRIGRHAWSSTTSSPLHQDIMPGINPGLVPPGLGNGQSDKDDGEDEEEHDDRQDKLEEQSNIIADLCVKATTPASELSNKLFCSIQNLLPDIGHICDTKYCIKIKPVISWVH